MIKVKRLIDFLDAPILDCKIEKADNPTPGREFVFCVTYGPISKNKRDDIFRELNDIKKSLSTYDHTQDVNIITNQIEKIDTMGDS